MLGHRQMYNCSQTVVADSTYIEVAVHGSTGGRPRESGLEPKADAWAKRQGQHTNTVSHGC